MVEFEPALAYQSTVSTGQILFYSGAALLVLTIILAVVFIIKKPRYVPENAVYGNETPTRTQKLRNGYPTEAMTRRRTTAPETNGQKIEEAGETEK